MPQVRRAVRRCIFAHDFQRRNAMHAALAKRVDELVECGWEPHTTTETSAALVGRRPFNWWLFLLVVVFFPFFGGILYLIFWLSTSRATIFLHAEGDEVIAAGDLWLVQLQEASREVYIEEHRQIKERGFLAVMWPKLLVFLALLALWVVFLRWYF
jgi:hypothetical protein